MAQEQSFAAMTRTIEMDVALSPEIPAGRIEARRIRIPAGVAAGLHVHNGPVVGNIVSGVVAYQIEGEQVQILRAGDLFFEPQGVRIARFDALDEDVTFLAYFVLAAGQDAGIEFPSA